VQVGVIVAAAGGSVRMRGTEKLFADLAGKPVLAWCIDTFEAHPVVSSIVVAMNEDNMPAGRELAAARGWSRCRFCLGGVRRQDSVAAALALLEAVDAIVVHDGDRPFVAPGMVDGGVRLMDDFDVAVAGVPAKDTVKVVDGAGRVVDTPDRASLRLVQTPQVFRAGVLRTVYRDACDDVTDDATLAEREGYRVCVYGGSDINIKITTPEDMIVARAIAAHWSAGA
jgi:2-C-methyl-D-erythritol 4-phosphate cytidylyltransferase